MALLEWVKANVGRAIDVDGEYGPQCFAGQFHQGWRWIPNAPTNYPVVGDVVVWRQNAEVGTTAFGHCAIALAANANTLLVFSQNWPPGSPSLLKLMDYRGVLGWQHYKGG